MKARGQLGQTTTEYLMISGMVTGMAAIVLQIMQVPLRQYLQRVAEFVVGQMANPPY
jgi:hypothetical protein